MKINQSGFERLALTSKRTEVVITPDRENSRTWFIDYTKNRGKKPCSRISMTSTQLKAAIGIADLRLKKNIEYLPGKFFRDENTVIIPPTKDGIKIAVTKEVKEAVQKLLTSNRRALN